MLVGESKSKGFISFVVLERNAYFKQVIKYDFPMLDILV